MPDFVVSIVKSEFKEQYLSFSNQEVADHSDDVKELYETGELSQQIVVKAETLDDACQVAEKDNPEHSAIKEHSFKAGW